MKRTDISIKKQLKMQMPILRSEYKINRIGLFGSVAEGKATPKSDVDLLVTFTESPGFFTFIKLENYLSNLLKRRVDLVTKEALKPLIRDQILRQVTYV